MKYEYYQEVIFTKEECEKIIKLHKNYPALEVFRKLELSIDIENSRINYVYRNEEGKKEGKAFFVYDIVRNEETEWLFEKLINWFIKVTNVKLKDTETLSQISLLNYKKGDFFMKHSDIRKNHEGRRWTVNAQLNNDYTGGEYILYRDDEQIILNKDMGNAITYWAGTEHEVKEITEGERWSLILSITKKLLVQDIEKTLL